MRGSLRAALKRGKGNWGTGIDGWVETDPTITEGLCEPASVIMGHPGLKILMAVGAADGRLGSQRANGFLRCLLLDGPLRCVEAKVRRR
jgi:hypothetical protein